MDVDDWPGCGACRHLHSRRNENLNRKKGTGITCDAFPNGIPLPFASGDVSHMKPVNGDNGIQFEPRVSPIHAPSKVSLEELSI